MRQIIESRNSYQSVVEERQVPLRTALEAGASAWKGRALSFSKECSSLGLQTTLPDTGERSLFCEFARAGFIAALAVSSC